LKILELLHNWRLLNKGVDMWGVTRLWRVMN
jgi:hypothetical protein